MSSNLYQLMTTALPGQHVLINGPYDKFGLVLKHRPSGFHLIRGLGHETPTGVSVFTVAQSIK